MRTPAVSSLASRLRPWLVGLLLLWAVIPAVAQEGDAPNGDTSGRFFESLDVEIVNVDVWVTDRDGLPVHGLEADDFVVLRDGQPVPITNFYAVSRGRAVQPEPTLPTIEPTPESAADEISDLSLDAERAIDPAHRLWLIVFLDNFNLDPLDRNRVLPGVRQFLSRTLRDGDQAMLVTYDRKLEVRVPFTDDIREFDAVTEAIEEESGFVTVRKRDQADTLERIIEAQSPGQSLSFARRYAEEQMDSVDRTAETLLRLIETLGGLEGRKALLHVSSGIPMLAGEEAFHTVAEKWGTSEAYAEIPRHDTTRRFERVTRQANAHRVTMHTLDAAGLRSMQFGQAEYAGFVNPRIRSTLDSVVPENLQSSLRLMARETGGQAILNRNDVTPALNDVASDFGSFYSLGISSTGIDAGSYHALEVELRDDCRRCSIRHREGYLSKSAATRMQETLRSVLLYTDGDNRLGVAARLGRPTPHTDDGLFVVPVDLEIPLRDLVLLPVAGGKAELRLELYVAAAGDDGALSAVDTVPLGLRIDARHVEAARGESFRHTHRLLLPAGRRKIGLAVFDTIGGERAVLTRALDVGAS
ncbi:MAG: VWA domain-containing protein [Acidobacteriota bacterium]